MKDLEKIEKYILAHIKECKIYFEERPDCKYNNIESLKNMCMKIDNNIKPDNENDSFLNMSNHLNSKIIFDLPKLYKFNVIKLSLDTVYVEGVDIGIVFIIKFNKKEEIRTFLYYALEKNMIRRKMYNDCKKILEREVNL